MAIEVKPLTGGLGDHRLLGRGERLEEFLVDDQEVGGIDVAVEGHELLQLVQLVVVDHADRVLLTVDHAVRKRVGQLGPGDRRRLAAQALDHLDIERDRLDAELQAGHVRRIADLAGVVDLMQSS